MPEKRLLDGIKVVELCNFVAAPCTGRMLADFGAEVIKVEIPRGDGWRGFGLRNTAGSSDEENPVFEVYNSNKKDIALDLKKPQSMEILHKLLEKADILISNTRLKSLVKMGLDPDNIRKKYPKIIYTWVGGYGEKGPDAEKPAFDTSAFWGKSGFTRDMAVEAEGGYPVSNPWAVGDQVTCLAVLSGVFAALYRRALTGKGETVKVSLYNTSLWVMSSMIIVTQKKYANPFPKPRSSHYPLNTYYRCSDGEWVLVVINEPERYEESFYKSLGYPDFKTNPPPEVGDISDAGKVIAFFEKIFIKKRSDEWEAILKEADIVCVRMSHFKDAENDEQGWANEYVEYMTFRNGEKGLVPRPPIRLESEPPIHSGRGPAVGEHTEEILKSLGYTREQIQNFINEEVVKTFKTN